MSRLDLTLGTVDTRHLPSLEALSTPFLVAASQTELKILANTYIKVINAGVHTIVDFDADTTFAAADKLDSGVIEAGKDYYVYVCDDGEIVVSLNSTFPAGYSADNSRKVGGFHTLCVDIGTIASHPGSGFVAGNVIPNSVWCLNFQVPLGTRQEGKAYVSLAHTFLGSSFSSLPSLNEWCDIYLQSSSGSTTASVYGATITDTRAWNDFVDDQAAVGSRLPDDAGFQIAALGSNEKTNIVGSADPVTTGGHSDTGGRRMVSYYFLEDMCGVMWQWIRDQSWQFARGAVAYAAAGLTTTVYHAAAPGGNPIYVKFGLDGTPYLCCNMGTATADKVLTFGAIYKLAVKHDADAATGGLPLYFDYDAAPPYRCLINNTIYGKDVWAFTTDPNYLLPLKHNPSADTYGVAVNYDDGADDRLEYISPGAANATMDLAMTHTDPAWGYQDLGGNKGSINKQGTYGDVKLAAGGRWNDGTYCGSRCRSMSSYRWFTYAGIGARGCAEPR